MKSLSNRVVLGCLLLQICFHSVRAYQQCGLYNGKYWECRESNTYCCGFRSGVVLCCEYDPFYTWWYFWVGMVALIFLLSACITLCRRRHMNQAAVYRNMQTATVVQQTQQQPVGGYSNMGYPAAVVDSSAPPPYPTGTNEQKNVSAPPPYNPQGYENIVTPSLAPQQQNSGVGSGVGQV